MRRSYFPARLLSCVLVLIFAFSGIAAAKTGKSVIELEHAAVGDIVVFGAYEQDNNLSNGKEAVEWIVLSIRGDRALLLSRYGLDAQPFNTENKEVTWKTCSLRKWLNYNFYEACFDNEEQNRIVSSTVRACKNWKYMQVNPGKNTRDNVFLLSTEEARKCPYFKNLEYEQHKYGDELRNDKRLCVATEYAKKNGAYVGKEGTSYWWLRTPGPNRMHAAYINTDGSVFGGGMVFHNDRVVRPAIWVSVHPGTAADTTSPDTEKNGKKTDAGSNTPFTAPARNPLAQDKSSNTGEENSYDDLENLFDEFMSSRYGKDNSELQEDFEEFLEMNDRSPGQFEDYDDFIEDKVEYYAVSLEDLFEEFIWFWDSIDNSDLQENFEEFLEMNNRDPDQFADFDDFIDEQTEYYLEDTEWDENDILIDDDYDDLFDDYPNDYPDDDFYEDYGDFYEYYGDYYGDYGDYYYESDYDW